MPVGFKNSTDGNIQVALNAIQSSRIPHNFLGLDRKGQISTFKTKGNPYGHLILRGSDRQPNFDAAIDVASSRASENDKISLNFRPLNKTFHVCRA